MIDQRKKRRQKNETHALSVTQKFEQTERYTYTPRQCFPPTPPVIATPALSGGDLSFLDYLSSEQCQPYLTLLFGERCTAAATMLRDFRYAKHGLFFGHRRTKPGGRPPKNPGRLDEANAKTKAALMEFARRAYRGDPQRRSQVFWKQIAGLIWQSYEHFRALRAKCNKIKQQEENRIFGLTVKRLNGAARVNAYRARHKAKLIAKLDAQRDARSSELYLVARA